MARSIINQPIPRAAVALVTDRQVDADLPASAVVLQAFVHAAKGGALVFPADAIPILVAHFVYGDARALAAFELCQGGRTAAPCSCNSSRRYRPSTPPCRCSTGDLGTFGRLPSRFQNHWEIVRLAELSCSGPAIGTTYQIIYPFLPRIC